MGSSAETRSTEEGLRGLHALSVYSRRLFLYSPVHRPGRNVLKMFDHSAVRTVESACSSIYVVETETNSSEVLTKGSLAYLPVRRAA